MLAHKSTRLSQAGAREIDWSNPITLGLAEASLSTSAGPIDVIRRSSFTKNGTPTLITRDRGVATATVSPAGYYQTGRTVIASLAECCILSFGSMPPGNQPTTQLCAAGATASGNPLLMLGQGGSSTLSFRTRNLASAEVQTAGGDFKDGVARVYLGNRSESGNFQRVYANGVLQATAASGSLGATTFNSWALHGMLRTSWGLAMTSNIFLSLLWARSLSDVEIASISANPWQIFR